MELYEFILYLNDNLALMSTKNQVDKFVEDTLEHMDLPIDMFEIMCRMAREQIQRIEDGSDTGNN